MRESNVLIRTLYTASIVIDVCQKRLSKICSQVDQRRSLLLRTGHRPLSLQHILQMIHNNLLMTILQPVRIILIRDKPGIQPLLRQTQMTTQIHPLRLSQ